MRNCVSKPATIHKNISGFPFNDAFMDVVIGRMAQNQQFCERVLDDAKFGDTVRDLLVGVVYERLRSTTGSGIHP